jgi:plasmid stability protein
MTTLTIGNVDPELREQLRVGAARRGRSMEAELRQILKEALGLEKPYPEPNLAEAIRRRFLAVGRRRRDRAAPAGVRRRAAPVRAVISKRRSTSEFNNTGRAKMGVRSVPTKDRGDAYVLRFPRFFVHGRNRAPNRALSSSRPNH